MHAREPAVHIRPEPDRRVVDPAGRRNRITGINLRVRREPASRQLRRGNEDHGRAQERSIPPGDHHTGRQRRNRARRPRTRRRTDESTRQPRRSTGSGWQAAAAGAADPSASRSSSRTRTPTRQGIEAKRRIRRNPKTSSPTPTSLRAQHRPGRPGEPAQHAPPTTAVHTHEDPPAHARTTRKVRPHVRRPPHRGAQDRGRPVAETLEARRAQLARQRHHRPPLPRQQRGPPARHRPDPRIRRHALGRIRPDSAAPAAWSARARRARRSSSGASAPAQPRPGAEDTDNEEDRPRFFATVHNVFNVAQADGLDLDDPAAESPALRAARRGPPGRRRRRARPHRPHARGPRLLLAERGRHHDARTLPVHRAVGLRAHAAARAGPLHVAPVAASTAAATEPPIAGRRSTPSRSCGRRSPR